jgi:outer membrane protein OmpA-like peptidoglycan-associated protein
MQINFRILSFALFLLTIPVMMHAQKEDSKSKSSPKEYEKPAGSIAPGVIIKNAETVNSPYLEFSPVFYQNGIVYVTSRQKGGAVDEKIGETFFELYYSELDGNRNPIKAQDFSINVNSQVHEGPVSFNRKGDVLYFTRNNMKNGVRKADSKGVTRLKIYEAQKGEFDWENVTELPFNSDEYSTCHPALSADGRRLYFTSDMPGGYGGFDLYFVERRGDDWSRPINLGGSINTDKNEVFPFMHESGVLFFSSNGHPGYGGLDIFKVDLSKKKWSAVVNLGVPFNSSQDDLGFILDPNSQYGFFSSTRSGSDTKGKDDIYKFELPNGIQGVSGGFELPVNFVVYDEVTNARIPGAAIRFFERSPDGFIEGNEYYDVSLVPADEEGQEVKLELIRKNAEYLGEPALYTGANGEKVDRIKADRNYLILVTKDGYTTGEATYSTAGENTPQTVRIGLRPKACAQVNGRIQLLNAGTPVAGATVEIVNNCNDEAQQLRANSEGVFEICLPLGCDYTLSAQKTGYAQATERFTTSGLKPGVNKPIELNLELESIAGEFGNEPIKEGTVFILDNIYYDFNKSAIRKGAARELDALAKLMEQYPSMEIEMVAHTDSRGEESYNLELSQQRAASAREYLISRGINPGRINAIGKGESQLRNRCVDGVDCSEQEHQYNRRTEVRVSKIDEELKDRIQQGKD